MIQPKFGHEQWNNSTGEKIQKNKFHTECLHRVFVALTTNEKNMQSLKNW